MPTAAGAITTRRAGHAVRRVVLYTDRLLQRPPETRPSRCRCRTSSSTKTQVEIASGAGKIAPAMFVVQRAGEGALRIGLPQNRELRRRQRLAPLFLP